MKFTCAVLVLLVVATATGASVPQNLTEDVGQEFHSVIGGYGFVKKENWQLVPDTDGKMHLVDINSVDLSVEPLFDAFNDVIFRLWTRSNRNAGQPITIYNDAQLAASNFNPAHRTQFQIHGWNGGGQNTGGTTGNHLLDQIDCNFIGVDWGAGARTPNYILARNRVNDTGAIVALYAEWFNTRGVPYSAMTFVGHSLGAHVAGAAGKKIRNGIVHAVVALDPAGPLFSLDDPANRVHHTDAQYVESIITDGGRLGFQHPIGHANFYPNWGTGHPIPQPGCPNDPTGQCGHSLVGSFYAASVNPAHVFGAIRCRNLDDIRNENCVVSGPSRRMGGEPIMDGPSPVGSVFFLETNPDPPFAQGQR